MRLLSPRPRKSRRERAIAIIRQLAKRRASELESGLLRHAADQIADGETTAARVTLERFEITAAALSKHEIAILQCAKDTLAKTGSTGIGPAIAKAVFGLALNWLPKLWHWIKTQTQIYFLGYSTNDPRNSRIIVENADGGARPVVASSP
jgi:hypothetical protein